MVHPHAAAAVTSRQCRPARRPRSLVRVDRGAGTRRSAQHDRRVRRDVHRLRLADAGFRTLPRPNPARRANRSPTGPSGGHEHRRLRRRRRRARRSRSVLLVGRVDRDHTGALGARRGRRLRSQPRIARAFRLPGRLVGAPGGASRLFTGDDRSAGRQATGSRPGDGYVAFQRGFGSAREILGDDPADDVPRRHASPMTTGLRRDARVVARPRQEPRLGARLRWSRVLRCLDTTPGIQDAAHRAVDLGPQAPTAQLRQYQELFGGIALALDQRASIPTLTCTRLRPERSASPDHDAVSRSCRRPQGPGDRHIRGAGDRSGELLGRTVPKIKPVGRVPLGPTKKGVNHVRLGRQGRGQGAAQGQVPADLPRAAKATRSLATSGSVQFKVTAGGDLKGFKGL